MFMERIQIQINPLFSFILIDQLHKSLISSQLIELNKYVSL
jgi:hypothetical protein